MQFHGWNRRGGLLPTMAVLAGLVTAPATAGSSPVGGSRAPAAEMNVVLSGSYTCNYSVTSYYTGAPGDPEPVYETYAETTDNLYMTSTGGNPPPGAPAAVQVPAFIGPGFGGGRPTVGQLVPVTPTSGFGTGHSFDGGSIEECVRFAQTMSASAQGLGCSTSDVRRRQPPLTAGSSYASASLTFVCEGAQSSIVHGMGELSRAVLALKLSTH
jgi:hypothetical protein